MKANFGWTLKGTEVHFWGIVEGKDLTLPITSEAVEALIAADLLAEIARLEGLVMVYLPVYEAMRDAPGAAEMAHEMRKLALGTPR